MSEFLVMDLDNEASALRGECAELESDVNRLQRILNNAILELTATPSWNQKQRALVVLQSSGDPISEERPQLELCYLWRDLQVQVLDETKRQQGWQMHTDVDAKTKVWLPT